MTKEKHDGNMRASETGYMGLDLHDNRVGEAAYYRQLFIIRG